MSFSFSIIRTMPSFRWIKLAAVLVVLLLGIFAAATPVAAGAAGTGEDVMDNDNCNNCDCDACCYNNSENNNNNNEFTLPKKKTNNSQKYDSSSSSSSSSSETSRRMVSIGQIMTNPSFLENHNQRKSYPETNPHICLAFLSCCDRIDLLNYTLSGIIQHIEKDEPKELKYEIAWVDNGSSLEKTQSIVDTYQIEHALVLSSNMGLAYGMNLLIHNLCTAPYILLLEEDWLYLDDLVAPQTTERKRVLATSIAVLESFQQHNIRAYDSRQILGIFLRHETYETFLTFPHSDIWETYQLQSTNFTQLLSSTAATTTNNNNNNNNDYCEENDNNDTTKDDKEDDNDDDVLSVDYRIFCADTGLHGDSIWGSYTNGAGLYRRHDLMYGIGRMYGEPGDAFHDRYVEGNYAFRAALSYCHATLRLTSDKSCTAIDNPKCTGAFHHIGGGRGTRPRTAQGTKCADPSWNFYGTPLYEKYLKMAHMAAAAAANNNGKKGAAVVDVDVNQLAVCTDEELQELRAQKFRDLDSKEYREQVEYDNLQVFEQERLERDKIRYQASMILTLLETNGGIKTIQEQVPFMAKMTQEEIRTSAERMLKLMDSPHPLQGYWDSHGRIIGSNDGSGG